MNDFEVKKSAVSNHFDIVRRIETISGEIPYAIKQFKSQVSYFRSMDKKLTSLKSKTEKKASGKMLDKLDAFISEYESTYRKCRQSYASVSKALDELSELYSRLRDYYYTQGKRREAKRAVSDGERLEKSARKQLSDVFELLNSANELSSISDSKEEERLVREDDMPKSSFTSDARTRESVMSEDAMRRPNPYQQNPANPYAYAHYDYRMPPQYYQPMPSFNIAPISIDVNAAVESAVESFTKAFEEKIGEYLAGYEAQEKRPSDITEGESLALNKVIEDEGFALDELSLLLEKISAMLSTLSELTATYSSLEEKTRTLADSMKSASDTQRALAREIQGIQATQKVISGDQLKLAEEQAIVVEEQKTAISRQAELKEAEAAVAGEITMFVDGANQALEALKDAALRQSDIASSIGEAVTASDKLLALQKNLEERQCELTEMQREALLAQKRLMRSQRAVNERSGAKIKARKENGEPEAVEAQEAEKELLEAK